MDIVIPVVSAEKCFRKKQISHCIYLYLMIQGPQILRSGAQRKKFRKFNNFWIFGKRDIDGRNQAEFCGHVWVWGNLHYRFFIVFGDSVVSGYWKTESMVKRRRHIVRKKCFRSIYGRNSGSFRSEWLWKNIRTLSTGNFCCFCAFFFRKQRPGNG